MIIVEYFGYEICYLGIIIVEVTRIWSCDGKSIIVIFYVVLLKKYIFFLDMMMVNVDLGVY